MHSGVLLAARQSVSAALPFFYMGGSGCESQACSALTPRKGSVRRVGLCFLGLLQKAHLLSAQETAKPCESSLALPEVTTACISVPSPVLCRSIPGSGCWGLFYSCSGLTGTRKPPRSDSGAWVLSSYYPPVSAFLVAVTATTRKTMLEEVNIFYYFPCSGHLTYCSP